MFRQHKPEEMFLSLNFFTSLFLKITPVPHLSAPTSPPKKKQKKKKGDKNVYVVRWEDWCSTYRFESRCHILSDSVQFFFLTASCLTCASVCPPKQTVSLHVLSSHWCSEH